MYDPKFPAKRLLTQYKALLAALVVFTFLTTALETLSIGLIVPLLDSLMQTQTAAQSYGWVVEKLNLVLQKFPQDNPLVSICLFLLVMTLYKVIFKIASNTMKVMLTFRVRVDCQRAMFEKNINSDMNFFIRHKSGDLVYRSINLPGEVSAYFTLMPRIFIEAINVLLISVLMVSISPGPFVVVIGVGVLFGFVVWLLSKKVFTKAGKVANDAYTWQNIILNESLGGIREIITYGKRTGWSARFWEQCIKYYKIKVSILVLRLVPGSLLELFAIGGICAIGIAYGLVDPAKAAASLPVLAVYAVCIVRIIPSFSSISQDKTQMASLAPAVGLYEKYIHEKTDPIPKSGIPFGHLEEDIKFENVSFAYEPDKPVLEGMNLTIPKQKTVALVGGSGAGKTTLVDLLLRLYEVDSGAILVDGKNLKAYAPDSWRERIGVVAQNSTIFNASVKENIALQFDGVDLDRVKACSEAAGVDEFVREMKDGYETELGDRGFRLSGGQRQRIAIARALYRQPEILIFDEATSALDNRTERIITETMTKFLHQKTVLILAHRFSTIEKADLIYVLKEGRVVQAGTHEELAQEKGEYTSLYQQEIIP